MPRAGLGAENQLQAAYLQTPVAGFPRRPIYSSTPGLRDECRVSVSRSTSLATKASGKSR